MNFLPLVHLVDSVPQYIFSYCPISVFRQMIRVTKWTAKWFPADTYVGDPPQWLETLKNSVFRRHRRPLDF